MLKEINNMTRLRERERKKQKQNKTKKLKYYSIYLLLENMGK